MNRNSHRHLTATRIGFTLVELLVVIAITGVLVALILPAVQAAREAARRTQCINNLKQIGLALTNHHDAKGHYPSGRESDDQFGASWAFETLPYMEQQQVYQAFDKTKRVDDDANSQAMRTPVPAYYCPTRRAPVADRDFDNDDAATLKPGVAAAGDYAANSGVSTRIGTNATVDGAYDAGEAGPIFSKSRINARHVTDGLSTTFVVGEKYMPPVPEDADPGEEHADIGDSAFFSGDNRHAIFRRSSAAFPTDSSDTYPGQYGSEHGEQSNFVFLDGSVHSISHDVDRETFAYLSIIRDDQQLPDNIFDIID